ncbi:hypothetical protein GLE_4678 [Lysobacter enzymogenes]|uniref:Uncharacterized protein n=1 Tax=Lysobacter enzymogenes TaxID=69 RepID=A0A0S2DNK7_LYSEN|nr:hypothetical protein GLE_4678 [Lysobacter enzymogenes]
MWAAATESVCRNGAVDRVGDANGDKRESRVPSRERGGRR